MSEPTTKEVRELLDRCPFPSPRRTSWFPGDMRWIFEARDVLERLVDPTLPPIPEGRCAR